MQTKRTRQIHKAALGSPDVEKVNRKAGEPMRIAICDDDEEIRGQVETVIKECIKKYDTEAEIVCFDQAKDLIIENMLEMFDAIFLDIEMPQMKGDQAAAVLRKNCKKQILIFVSSHEDMVFDLLGCQPLAFVRKRQLELDLRRAVAEMMHHYEKNNQKIVITTKNASYTIPASEIWYIEIYGHKLVIHKKDSTLELRHTLNDIETMLAERGFIKTHRAYLVNYRYLFSIEKDHVILDDGLHIPLSKYRQEETKKKLVYFMRMIEE